MKITAYIYIYILYIHIYIYIFINRYMQLCAYIYIYIYIYTYIYVYLCIGINTLTDMVFACRLVRINLLSSMFSSPCSGSISSTSLARFRVRILPKRSCIFCEIPDLNVNCERSIHYARRFTIN